MMIGIMKMTMMVIMIIMTTTTTTTFVHGSIQEIEVILYPTDEFVQYTNAYIRSPGGKVDLTQLAFKPISESYYNFLSNDAGILPGNELFDDIAEMSYADDIMEEEMEDDIYEEEYYEDDNEGAVPSDDVTRNRHRHRRTLKQQLPQQKEFMVKNSHSRRHYQRRTLYNDIYNKNINNWFSSSNSNSNNRRRNDAIENTTNTTETPPLVTNNNTNGTIHAAATAPTSTTQSMNPSTVPSSSPVAVIATPPVEKNDKNEDSEEDDFLEEIMNGDDFNIGADGIEESDSVIDIIVFPLPSYCMKDETKCQWSELGIGKLTTPKSIANVEIDTAEHTSEDDYYTDEPELRWCCTSTTIDLGLCTQENFGRLMIDTTKFKGIQLSITIPYNGNDVIVHNNDESYVLNEDKSGDYAVMFGNCNVLYGREVEVIGDLIFESSHGYLPGELYGFMIFYIIITFVYIILFIWYSLLMKLNYEYRIDIEKWIITAISLGLLEMIFRTMDYLIWNSNGIRSNPVIWIGILCGVCKQGFTRCLVVMVSMGWGVIRNTLSTIVMNVLIALTISFIVVSTLIDAAVLVAIENMNKLSYNSESEILNVVSLLTAIKATIDIIFFIWMIDSITKTLKYLSTQKNQVHKLERTKQLRNIIVLSFILALVVIIISLIDSYQNKNGGANTNTMIHEEFAWAIDGANEVIYLFVLINIAILWRPNPQAKQYAYVMELRTSDDDYDFDDNNQLELSSMDVPSAIDNDFDSIHSNNRMIT